MIYSRRSFLKKMFVSSIPAAYMTTMLYSHQAKGQKTGVWRLDNVTTRFWLKRIPNTCGPAGTNCSPIGADCTWREWRALTVDRHHLICEDK